METKTAVKTKDYKNIVLLNHRARFLAWKKVEGMWKNRRPDPIRMLNKIRKEWERVYP